MAIGAEEATLKLSVETNEAEAALDKFAKKAKDTGSSIEKELGGALDVLEGKWGPQAELAKRFFAIVSEGVEKFIAFAERGDRVSDVMGALSTNLDEATRRTSGMIGKMELAIAANAATEAGLRLSGDQFASVAVAAKRYADATGTDVPAAMDRLVNAIVRGSARGLKPFGIHATDTAGAVKELTERLGSATVAAEGFSDKLDATRSRWEEFKDGIAVEVDTQSGTGLFGMFLDGLTKITGGMDHLGASIVWVGRSMLTIGNPFGAFVDVADKWLRVLEDPIMRTLYGRTRGQVDAAAFMDSEDRTPGSETTAPLGMRYSSAPRERPSTRRAEPARRGGGGSAQARADEVWARVQREQQVSVQIVDLRGREADMLAERSRAQAERDIAAIAARGEAEQRASDARLERWRAEDSAMRRQWAASDRATQAAEDRVGAERELWGGLTEQIASSTFAAIQNGVAQGMSAKQIATGIAKAAAWHAAEEGLLGLASLAVTWGVPNPASIGHFAAAAGFAALAGGAGIAAAVSPGGHGGSGRASGGHTAGSLRGGAGGGEGGGNVTNITVMLDAAGGVIQDSQLRRLGRYVSDAQARGYVNGNRRAA